MNRYLYALMLLCLLTGLSCVPSNGQIPTPTPQATERISGDNTTPVILADTAFSGWAYVDQNGNQILDPADPPLPGARFSVLGWGSLTDQTGYAWALIPGGWDKPAPARMDPPEGSGYTLIGPREVILQSGVKHSADFLFAPPPVASPTRTPSATPPPPEVTPT